MTATNVNNMYLLFSICSTKLSRVSLQCSHVTMTLNKCPNALKAQVSSCYNIADFVLHAFGVIPQQPKSTYISWWGLTHQNLFLIVQPTDLEHPNNAVMWQWHWTNAQMRLRRKLTAAMTSQPFSCRLLGLITQQPKSIKTIKTYFLLFNQLI